MVKKKVLETIPGSPPAVSEHTRVKKIWSIWETRDCFVSRLAFYNIRLGCKKIQKQDNECECVVHGGGGSNNIPLIVLSCVQYRNVEDPVRWQDLSLISTKWQEQDELSPDLYAESYIRCSTA